MLEGLEVTEILFSWLNLKNDRFRIDAEFVQKEYFEFERVLTNKPFKYLNETDCLIIHPSEIKREFVKEGIWFFRTQNLRPLKIENSNDVYISIEDAVSLKKNNITYGDILITRTGANYGQTAIYDLQKIAIASSHVLILRNTYFNQFYLAVFFNTKFGKKMIDKGMYGAAQPEIAPYYLSYIPIPNFSKVFQNKIEIVYQKASIKVEQSQNIYSQSEALLLQNLSLSNYQPTQQNTAIKKFSNSFALSGRLDAEYYQPKYEEIVDKIKAYKNGWKYFSECIMLKDENVNPEDKSEYQYIELADIGNLGEIISCIKDIGIHLPSRARQLVKKNDVLISSIEGSLNKCALITKKFENAFCSTGFYIISSNEVLPEVLLLLFKSAFFQELMKGKCSGTILTAISKEELKTIPIPILPIDTQKQLADQIQQSFKLRQESTRLIDLAKQAVEIAIEQDEEAAIHFLKAHT